MYKYMDSRNLVQVDCRVKYHSVNPCHQTPYALMKLESLIAYKTLKYNWRSIKIELICQKSIFKLLERYGVSRSNQLEIETWRSTDVSTLITFQKSSGSFHRSLPVELNFGNDFLFFYYTHLKLMDYLSETSILLRGSLNAIKSEINRLSKIHSDFILYKCNVAMSSVW